MKDGVCPKCGSKDVHCGAKIGRVRISNFAMPATLDNYVCIRCGYVESYISDTMKLFQIARKWPKVKKR